MRPYSSSGPELEVLGVGVPNTLRGCGTPLQQPPEPQVFVLPSPSRLPSPQNQRDSPPKTQILIPP